MKRSVLIKRHGRLEKLGRKKATSKYYNLMAYYDTPQFYDEVMEECRYIIEAIEEGYNIITIEEGSMKKEV